MRAPAVSVAAAATAAAVPFAVAGVLVFRSGGYPAVDSGVVALGFTAAAAGAMVVWGRGERLLPWLAVTGLLGLAVWQVLSAGRADDPALARQTALPTAAYAAAGCLVLVASRRSWLPRLVDGAFVVAALAGLAGLAARLFPSFGADTEPRLSWPITYWNSEGAVIALAAVLALGVAGSSSRHIVRRAASAATLPPLVLALAMTFSRGAFVALALGAVFVLACGPDRTETVAAALACALPTAVLVWVAAGERGIIEFTLPIRDAAAGHRVALFTVCASAVAALLTAATAVATRRLSHGIRVRLALLAAAGLVAACIAGLVVARPAEGYRSWASDRVHEITSTKRPSDSATHAYLTASGNGRWDLFAVAVDEWKSAPLAGTGTGDFRFWWREHRPDNTAVLNAHSVYLETLGESGLVGLVLLLAFVAAVLVSAPLVRRSGSSALAREAAAAGGACLAVFLHAAVDWDWQFPAVMLPVAALGFGVVRAASPPRAAARPVASLVALPLLLLVVLLAGGVVATVDVARGKSAAREGHLPRALQLAESAARFDPQSSDAQQLQGAVLSDLGRAAESDAAYARAIARSPHDDGIYDDWAASLLQRGAPAPAKQLLRRSLELNPHEERTQLLLKFAAK